MSVPINKLRNKNRNNQQNNNRGPGGRGGGGNNNNNNRGGRGGGGHGGRGGRNTAHQNPQKGGGGGESRDVLRTMLKLVFEKQSGMIYNNGVLQLVAFRDCPDLADVKKSVDFDTVGFCDSLCSVIREVLPDVQFLQIDRNGIRSMNHLVDALIKHQLHMVIRGISATDNKINDLGFINKLARFKNLIEVCFSSNPIAQKGDYRPRLSKRLPQLMGIDGEGIERRPLTLPWPEPAQYNEAQQQVLMWLEQLLQGLGTGGPDQVGFSYGVSSLFSINIPVELSFSLKTDAKQIHAGVQDMRSKIKDHNRNLVQITGNTANKVARGRSEVCVSLTNCVYPRGFQVEHTLDSNADVQFINENDGVLAGCVIVTIHGLMTWHHPHYKPNDRPLSFCFDRTFVLVQEQDWVIMSDLLTLRDRNVAAIFMGDSAMRVEPLSTKTGLPQEVVQAILSNSTNDTDLANALNEVAAIGPDALGECSVATESPAIAIAMARVIARCNVTTEAALAVVTDAQGDLEAATAAAQQLPPEAFRQ